MYGDVLGSLITKFPFLRDGSSSGHETLLECLPEQIQEGKDSTCAQLHSPPNEKKVWNQKTNGGANILCGHYHRT
ncbi:hypothetical protein AALO_G00261160 [Alosa alosa]|uniref:Uncharacterized protein n=1 Tax=Alosa alosa TaxID=278164 RepID=A0AAV6FR83_9TELE|nr:hypothetical protein AALO_G00261160 [Alosa alosa]